MKSILAMPEAQRTKQHLPAALNGGGSWYCECCFLLYNWSAGGGIEQDTEDRKTPSLL